jgi:hypothetical protein
MSGVGGADLPVKVPMETDTVGYELKKVDRIAG